MGKENLLARLVPKPDMTGLTAIAEPGPGNRPRFRLSHSALDIYNRCERKYQLICWMPQDPEIAAQNVDLSFGKAVGSGFQKYMITGDLDAAIFETFMAYHPFIEHDSTKQNRKYLERAVFAVEALANKWDQLPYKLLYFNGKPAVEVTFKLILNDYGDYYCGHMDAAVMNEEINLPGVIEVKTTGLSRDDLTPLYKFSPQALGYSMILDVIKDDLPNNFETVYTVAHLIRGTEWPDVKILPFTKTKLDRLNWMMSLIGDLNRMIENWENNFWPQRFQECLSYNRACQYMETCNLASWNEAQAETPEEFGLDYNAGKDWEFEFTLDEVYRKAT